MRAFRFPLQAILTLREEKEQAAQRAYAERLRAARAVEDRLEALGREQAQTSQQRQAALGRGTSALELEQMAHYGLWLQERREQLETELTRARNAVEEGWQQLLRATQEREAMERYRRKQKQAYDLHLARAEQKLLDDLAGRAKPETLTP